MSSHWSDRFFGPLYMRFDEMRTENFLDEVQGIIRLCKIRAHTRVVELCCGYGRILIPLVANTRAAATGIDKASSLLAAARESAHEQGIGVIWREANLLNYRGRHSFDVAYMTGNSFGYYDKTDTNLRVLQGARSLLKKNGTLLLDQWNCPTSFHGAMEDGEFRYERRTAFDPSLNVYGGMYTYFDKLTKNTFSFPFRAVLYRRSELSGMLTSASFGEFQFYGDFDGRAFREGGRRLVVVCKAL
jgi:SAM-dependent methyltransferase